jgi:hypothetical protein
MEKSLIVLEIIDKVHAMGGRFIKKTRNGNFWVEADDVFAKEKVSQSLRDGLSTKYKSATKTKKDRRSSTEKMINDDVDKIVRSNSTLVQKMKQLDLQVRVANGRKKPPSNPFMMSLFDRANAEMLEIIKNDHTMFLKFQDVLGSLSSESESCYNSDLSDLDSLDLVESFENENSPMIEMV